MAAGVHLPPHVVEAIRSARWARRTIGDIADEFDVTPMCVYQRTRDIAFSFAGRGRPLKDPARDRRLLAAADAGVPYADLGPRFGITESTARSKVYRLRRARRLQREAA